MERILQHCSEVGGRAETETRSELLYARRRRFPSASADEIESSASEPGAGTIEYSMTSTTMVKSMAWISQFCLDSGEPLDFENKRHFFPF